ncbi:MAG: T9SS type A sorting domain-containing protein, partial [Ignavibacteria bacterium]|nr:T9SS type A sorting domain-containing protein [Ignavibacteria bacterium]
GVAVGVGGLILRTANGGVPVELTSFTYNLVDNNVYLIWETATEINNNGFNIERKIKDEWKTLTFVKGAGTTTEEQSYSYTDSLADLSYSGKIQYRLKQIDFDGSFEYSFIIEVDYNSLSQNFTLYQNYPNPFNPTTTIQYSVPEEELVTIKVYDITGREVMTLVNEVKQQGSYEFLFVGSELSSGVYLYEMRAGSFSEVKQLILLK